MTTGGASTFGALLRSWRVAAGLTQEALAERAGLSVRAISSLERGERRQAHPHTVQVLARALRLSVADRARLAAARTHGPAPAPEPPAAEPAPPRAGHLPALLTSFVGRERAVAEVGRLLSRHRLVTLTGAGGIGKTRLALVVASRSNSAYADGVWFVDLAPRTDPALAPQAVVTALGLPETTQLPVMDRLIAYLAPRRLLLVLDNCEHLIGACAALAAALLAGCPHLHLLATSREPLGITGEAAWRVPSLALPAADGPLTAGRTIRAEAVRLFVERAALVQPGFAVTDDNAALVAEICRRLDGIPLALELAAARARMLPLATIAQRLDDRFGLLVGGDRTALPRQQTLRAMLDWSYDLLDAPERAVLCRLAVFVGSWTLAAAEAVGAGDGIAADTVLDLLTRLVDKSLVQVDTAEVGEARFRLLETVRQYALERLTALPERAGEADAARARHADYYLTLVEQATAGGRGGSTGWAGRLRLDWGNIFAALRWAAEHGAVERALLACGRLIELWILAGQYAAPRGLLADLLALPDADAATLGRARALLCAAELAFSQGDTTAARTYLDEALPICRARGDEPGHGWAVVCAGWVTVLAGDVATGRAQLEAALPLAQASGDPLNLAVALHFLGYIAAVQGETARARTLQHDALRLARQSGNPRTIASALFRLGQIAMVDGDYPLARARYVEAAMTISPLGYPVLLSGLLRSLAALVAAEGRPLQALRLAGAADRLGAATDVPAARLDLIDVTDRLAHVRAALGDAAAAAAWATGQAMTLDQAVTMALRGDDSA
ncbi:MAG: helix-turn-helix domain-containing protein [Chloroflexi bacterium]|nr:helix-turn-helix domain-containing protein [Chloroflexota bacterium]